jgi:hypothetical protein
VRFMQHSGASFQELLPNAKDLHLLRTALLRIQGRNRP